VLQAVGFFVDIIDHVSQQQPGLLVVGFVEDQPVE